MSVRCFARLLIVCIVIVSRNQACCHGASKGLASANPKTSTNMKPTSGKDLGMSYHKKLVESPRYWTGSKQPSVKLNEKAQARKSESSAAEKARSYEGANQQQSRSGPESVGVDKICSYLEKQQKSRSGSEPVQVGHQFSRHGTDVGQVRSHVGSSPDAFSANSKGYKIKYESSEEEAVEPVHGSYERGLARDLFRLSSGWDEAEQKKLREIIGKRLFSSDMRDRDDSDSSLETDLREKSNPGMRLSKEPYSQQGANHKYLDPDHIKEFNFKKSKALESFESEESFENNKLGKTHEKYVGRFKVQDETTSDVDSEKLLEQLTLNGLEYDSPSDKKLNRVAQSSPTQKSKADVLSEYGDVLQKVDELYKLLNAPIASGAEKLDDPEFYNQKSRQEVYTDPPLNPVKSQSKHYLESRRSSKYYNSDEVSEEVGGYGLAVAKKVGGTNRKVGSELDSEDFRHPKRGQAQAGRYPDYAIPEQNIYPEFEYHSRGKPDIDSELSYAKSLGSKHRLEAIERERPESDKRRLQVGTNDEYAGFSQQKQQGNEESKYVESSMHRPKAVEADYMEDYERGTPVDTEYDYRQYSRQRPKTAGDALYTEEHRGRLDVSSPHPSQRPKETAANGYSGRIHAEYSSEEYPDVTPTQRNLASPQCKFENLDPSRELDSGEEDRYLQFRSFQRKSGNTARVSDDLGTAQDRNVKAHADGSSANQKYRHQNTDNEESSRLASSSYRGQHLDGFPASQRFGASRNIQNSGDSNPKYFEDTESPAKLDTPEMLNRVGVRRGGNTEDTNNPMQFEVQPPLTSKLDESPRQRETHIPGLPEPVNMIGVPNHGVGSVHSRPEGATQIPPGEQLQNSQALQSEIQGGPSGQGGCGNIFKCLAEMGQTLITPVKSGAEGNVGHPATSPHVGHTAPIQHAFDGNPNSYGSARDATGGGDTFTGSAGGPSGGSIIGANVVQNHPFYGLVHSILCAAQEATRQRLAESRNGRLSHSPNKVQQAQQVQHVQPSVAVTGSEKKMEMQGPAPTSTAPQNVGTGGPFATTPGGKIVGSGKAVGKPNVGVGRKTAAVRGMTGSGRKAVAGSGRTVTGTAKTARVGSLNGNVRSTLKSAAPQKSADTVHSKKPGKEVIGKARNIGSGTPTLNRKSGNGDQSGGKLEAFRKVTFQPVSFKAPTTPVAAKTPSSKVQQKAHSEAKVGSLFSGLKSTAKAALNSSKSESKIPSADSATPSTGSSQPSSQTKRSPSVTPAASSQTQRAAGG